MEEFYHQFICQDRKEYSLIIEDDARVCYAYLLIGEEIIGDVWLYNKTKTPTTVDWSNREEMPFLNPKKYVDESRKILPILSEDEIELHWQFKGNDLVDVDLFVRKKFVAKMRPGSKPGWSIAVVEDGPLAKRMEYGKENN